jgi:hypothetical protein
VNTVRNFGFHGGGDVLNSCVIINFSRRTLLHGIVCLFVCLVG